MYPIGLSLGTPNQREELFQQCSEAGIQRVEISTGRLAWLATLDFPAMRRYADQYGVELWSFHLPFLPFSLIDISSPNETVRSNTVALFIYLIRQAAAVGIRHFVIHPSGEPIKEEERPLYMAAAQKSLAELAEAADAAGGVMAVENLPRTCLGRDSADILELISADERLRVCFDTNHLLDEDPVEFIRKVGNKIVTTHVSDYDRLDERHWLPGEGNTDWPALLAALQEVGYNGAWLYELGFATPESILRPRTLTAADFVANANTIFEGKQPAPFGTPAEGLLHWEERARLRALEKAKGKS